MTVEVSPRIPQPRISSSRPANVYARPCRGRARRLARAARGRPRVDDDREVAADCGGQALGHLRAADAARQQHHLHDPSPMHPSLSRSRRALGCRPTGLAPGCRLTAGSASRGMDVRRSAIRRLESGRGGRAGSRSRQAGGRRVAAAAFEVDGPLATAATLALAVVLIGSIACLRARCRAALPTSTVRWRPAGTSAGRLNRSRPPRPRRRRIHADARSDTDADGGSHAGARCDARGDRYPRAGPDGHACADRDGRSDGHARPDVDSSTDRRPAPTPKPTPTPRPSIVPRRAATRDGVVPAALLATSDPSRARCRPYRDGCHWAQPLSTRCYYGNVCAEDDDRAVR